MTKERLDILVQHHAGVSRSKAQGLIQTGQVFDADGKRLDKPGLRMDSETPLEVREQPRFVSRGGEKIAAAFDAFPFTVDAQVCIDVGASTGGFTDCCLQEGAARVYAVDVGYGQLAWSLRQDERVVVMERVNARSLPICGGLFVYFVATHSPAADSRARCRSGRSRAHQASV